MPTLQEVKCLHLLKAFSPKHFETMMKKGKRGQISDLLLELPIEHQIYDMVDAEGDRGLPFNQVLNIFLMNVGTYVYIILMVLIVFYVSANP